MKFHLLKAMNFRLILALAVFASPALGQSPPLKARILTIALDQPLENAFFLNAGKVEPFTSDRSGLGTPFEYTGPRELILRANAADFAAKPPVPAPLASVLLPTQAQLILLVSGRDSEGKLKLTAYDVSAGAFRAGDYRVFNFSEKVVSLILGRSKFALKPGEDFIVSDVALQDQALDVVVQIAQVENGAPKKVYASAWGHQPVKRNFVFLFNGSHPTRPIAIRRFSDHPQKAP
jgi:hypothetical protein